MSNRKIGLVGGFVFAMFIALGGGCAMAQDAAAETPATPIAKSAVFVRFKVNEPKGERFTVTASGQTHGGGGVWFFPPVKTDVAGGAWSGWVDLNAWPWGGNSNRTGGVAEWQSMTLAVTPAGSNAQVKDAVLEVQLADQPNEAGVVHSFKESSESGTIGFLVPWPLRENSKHFETGTQMTKRHLAWAQETTGGLPITLKKFDVATNVTQYDPALARQAYQTLRMLGFNAAHPIYGEPTAAAMLKAAGLRAFSTTNVDMGNQFHVADPAVATERWDKFKEYVLGPALANEDGKWVYQNGAFFEISDELAMVDLHETDAAKSSIWFRDYLRAMKITDAELGQPVDQAVYPKDTMFARPIPYQADLKTRRFMYHAAKFGQWWAANQLRHSSDLIHGDLPNARTLGMPWDHPFFGGRGMNKFMLDLFEVGAQRSVDIMSSEDWLGLNRMYGPSYTWSGAQSLGYLNAIMRSGIERGPAAQPMMLGTFITMSDDNYLRLKAYSSIGQGVKSFYYWDYGPSYNATENYWSDLRSEYDGIAKTNRALEKSEDALYPARPVHDPVAILYSVSHDIWHANENARDPAAFVEKRLLWHGLRHLHVQPDFLREEDVAAGHLKDYKVLYIADWCVSRKASAAIDEWVRAGGVIYLSAGAATRDEYYEPYVPAFARVVWPDDAVQQFKNDTSPEKRYNGAGGEYHTYNERTDLPTIKPIGTVNVNAGGQRFDLPVIGARLNLRPGVAKSFATFDDGKPAGAVVSYGHGQVIGLGFMPMLAYGHLAGFKPITLEEKWPAQPRELVKLALSAAKIDPVAGASVPVVETSLLTGPNGSVLVLANYTYQAVQSLTVDVKVPGITGAVSTEGKPVKVTKTVDGARLELPLEWTDIIVLQK
ncbi:MAG: hypothetical protein ACYDCO_07620 [Armatimonadota bacterium]